MSEVLVKVDHVSKKFCRSLKRSLWYGVRDMCAELNPFQQRTPTGATAAPEEPSLRRDEFWALRDVSFELRRGECLGLIGHNGAGKTTLLKVLNGLIKPDAGRVELRGRVGALIALGAGFNPVLSGRENIYVNGSVVGLTRKEIDERIEEIIDFAGIRDFIDAPVQSYSSGMTVRLGFSVATAIRPDVLIVDEVLAVGDLAFILKCLDRIDHLMESTAVIFVSHSMPMVSRICSHVMQLDHGTVRYSGPDVSRGIDIYYQDSDHPASVVYASDSRYRVRDLKVLGQTSDGNLPCLEWGDDLDVDLVLETPAECEKLAGSLVVFDKEQKAIAVTSAVDILAVGDVVCGEMKTVRCRIRLPRIQFAKGVYSFTVTLSRAPGSGPLLRVKNAAFFQVTSEKEVWAPIVLDAVWCTPREPGLLASAPRG